MPKICEQCGKSHPTVEEMEAEARRGDEGLPSPEPLPYEIEAGETLEEISEEYAPKRMKKSKK